MQLKIVGINHQTSPVAIREKAAIGTDKLSNSLRGLKAYLSQGIILSTCNRTEVYSLDGAAPDGHEAALDFLGDYQGISLEDRRKYFYQYEGEDAIQHLFRVTAGLESMVVGEYEVLGQVKKALEAAEASAMVEPPLRQVFQGAIGVGRRIREETGISRSPVSVSSIALDLAFRTLGRHENPRLLVIGTGEAGQLVAKLAGEKGVTRIAISSKKIERAIAVAEKLKAVPLEVSGLSRELETTDIVVTCSSAPHWVLDVPRLEPALRRRSTPLVIMDIAVPRNVQPEVKALPGVFLYNIDQLKEISDSNLKQREKDIREAENIVSQELKAFMNKWQLLEVTPLISALMSRAEGIREAQLKKTLKKLPPLSEEQQANLESMTKSIVNRILQDPVEYLKSNGEADHCQLVRELFNLESQEHS